MCIASAKFASQRENFLAATISKPLIVHLQVMKRERRQSVKYTTPCLKSGQQSRSVVSLHRSQREDCVELLASPVCHTFHLSFFGNGMSHRLLGWLQKLALKRLETQAMCVGVSS
jgi:hypothetical protein